jgi:hypothetical protein
LYQMGLRIANRGRSKDMWPSQGSGRDPGAEKEAAKFG